MPLITRNVVGGVVKDVALTVEAAVAAEAKKIASEAETIDEKIIQDVVRATGPGIRRKKRVAPSEQAVSEIAQAKPVQAFEPPPLVSPEFALHQRRQSNSLDSPIMYFMNNAKRPLFIDDGESMKFVEKVPSDLDIVAMLKTAQKEYGEFELVGSPDFIERAAVIAGRYGFKIGNEDMQSRYEQGVSERLAPAPSPAP